jgi:hypothetical protein
MPCRRRLLERPGPRLAWTSPAGPSSPSQPSQPRPAWPGNSSSSCRRLRLRPLRSGRRLPFLEPPNL